MEKRLRIGTRNSALALKQAGEVMEKLFGLYPAISAEIVGIDTYGDIDKTTPIREIEGSDFFTREIDTALLEGKIDLAVHSAKDLADKLPPGLFLAAVTRSIDPYDVLVSKGGLTLGSLPRGARIGTSSLRRKEALKKFRPDLELVNIRGNVVERLELLAANVKTSLGLDAIVIAAAGLLRLGLGHRITERIPFEVLKPHPLQGRLAIVTRANDKDVIELINIYGEGGYEG